MRLSLTRLELVSCRDALEMLNPDSDDLCQIRDNVLSIVMQALADPEHTEDSDCDVDPETWTCRICGVDHSGQCLRCLGHGFHTAVCPNNTEGTPVDDDAPQPGMHDPCAYCGNSDNETCDRCVWLRASTGNG